MAFWEGLKETKTKKEKKEIKEQKITESKPVKEIPVIDEQITGEIAELKEDKEKKSIKTIDTKRLEEKLALLESKLEKVQEKTTTNTTIKEVKVPTFEKFLQYIKAKRDSSSICDFLYKRVEENPRKQDRTTVMKVLEIIREMNDL